MVSAVNGQQIPPGIDPVVYDYYAGILKTPGLITSYIQGNGGISNMPAKDVAALQALGVNVTPVGTGMLASPVVLAGIAFAVWYFFLRGKK